MAPTTTYPLQAAHQRHACNNPGDSHSHMCSPPRNRRPRLAAGHAPAPLPVLGCGPLTGPSAPRLPVHFPFQPSECVESSQRAARRRLPLAWGTSVPAVPRQARPGSHASASTSCTINGCVRKPHGRPDAAYPLHSSWKRLLRGPPSRAPAQPVLGIRCGDQPGVAEGGR